MARRTAPPFRADHVGSLLRPPELLKARADAAAGAISATQLRAIEDEAIAAVVRMQEDVGLQSATDGEFRRTSWHMDFIYRLGGVHSPDQKVTVEFRNAQEKISFEAAALAVTEPISLPETIFGDDFAYLRDAVSEHVTPKLTIPSPSMV